MQVAALLKDIPDPSDDDIDAVMTGNLCRCMTYIRIRNAVHQASAAAAKKVASIKKGVSHD
jgi:isoquinoline 1-oxidoreductase alpha subunit